MTVSHPVPNSSAALSSLHPRAASVGRTSPADAASLPDADHPESVYERRHANCDGEDLHDLPDFPRVAGKRGAPR